MLGCRRVLFPNPIRRQAADSNTLTADYRMTEVEPRPSIEPAAIADRAIGALLGPPIGDAIGTTLEFRVRDTYAPLTDMVDSGPFGLNAGE